MLKFGKLESDEDAHELTLLAQQTFNFPESYYQAGLKRMGLDAHRVVRHAGTIRAGLAIYEAGQWFGGRAVPMAGIAMVCVEPSLRRQGVGRYLLEETLRELRHRGIPFATLFPSTMRAYRRLGFEQAGSWYTQQHALVPVDTPGEMLPMHSVKPLDAQVFAGLADRRAQRTEGNLKRNDQFWQRIFDARSNPTPVRGYLIGPLNAPEGYVIYLQDRVNGTPTEDRLIMKDMVAETPLAARTLWNFMHGHVSTVSSVIWSGAAVDPLLMILSECEPKILNARRWMSRVIDVSRALESRGYRGQTDAKLSFDVEDSVLPENSGRYTLHVNGGQGRVEPGGPGELRIDIRGMAALFTGFCSADALRIAGRIEASDETVAIADEIFSGEPPWMPEYF